MAKDYIVVRKSSVLAARAMVKRLKARGETVDSATERLANAQPDPRPCKGINSNVCVAEGCYGEACLKIKNGETNGN